MDKTKILASFAALSRLGESELPHWESLVDATIEEIRSALRPEADETENASTLTYLCTALCCCRRAMLEDGEESFRTDGLSLSRKSAPAHWEKLREDALSLAKGLLRDDTFCVIRM